jgi:Ca2+-binding EF-hand superfamily protein
MFRLFSALAVAGTLLVAGGVRADDDGAKAKKKKLDPEMLFKKLDTNDDGYLSLEEFKKFGEMGKGKLAEHPERLEKMFKKLDADNDGKVSLEEFKKIGDLNKKKKKDGDPKPSDK